MHGLILLTDLTTDALFLERAGLANIHFNLPCPREDLYRLKKDTTGAESVVRVCLKGLMTIDKIGPFLQALLWDTDSPVGGKESDFADQV
jgi:hypothetical protein